MKTKIYILTFVLAAGILSSCDDDVIEFGSDFTKSHEAWQSFKKSSDNSYTYIATASSLEGGLNWKTTITVANGHVTRREFMLTKSGYTLPLEILQEWVENQDELNSHEDSGAADILTMDHIYKKAKNDWLQERSKTITYFETENNGLISVCGYMPKGCADDCFRGITISSIVK